MGCNATPLVFSSDYCNLNELLKANKLVELFTLKLRRSHLLLYVPAAARNDFSLCRYLVSAFALASFSVP